MSQKLRVITPIKYKRKIPFIFFIMSISSILEMLGVAIVIPFMKALTSYEELISDRRMACFVQLFHIKDFYGLLLFMGIGVFVVYLTKNVVLLFVRQYQNIFQCSIQSTLATEMLESCIMRPYSYFLTINSSDILTGIFNDSESVYQIIFAFLNFISECLTVLMICVLVFVTDSVLALSLGFIALICVVFMVLGLKRYSTHAGIIHRQSYNRMYQTAIQTIGGIKEIDVTGRKRYFTEKFKKEREEFRDAQIIRNLINLIPERLIEVLFICGIIMVLVFRVRWGLDVNSSIVVLSAFAVAGYRLLPSISKLSNNMTTLIYYQPSLDAAYNNIIEARNVEKDRIEYLKSHSVNEKSVDNKRFNKCLEIRDISFSYQGMDRLVLSGINLTIKKGITVAFIGESGAGKSTLSDIILGLLIPQKGNIYMDGVDIFTIPSKWNHIISYVPQSVYLLDASIKENIAFGIDEEEIQEDRVWEAIIKSQLDEYIKELPDGINTFVGERGVRLSGGQRQRIAIARALYDNPDIMILDEATSALDNETERAVMDAIDALHGQKTLIIIAHRLSTVSGCDEIYEIKDGHVIKRRKEEVLKDV